MSESMSMSAACVVRSRVLDLSEVQGQAHWSWLERLASVQAKRLMRRHKVRPQILPLAETPANGGAFWQNLPLLREELLAMAWAEIPQTVIDTVGKPLPLPRRGKGKDLAAKAAVRRAKAAELADAKRIDQLVQKRVLRRIAAGLSPRVEGCKAVAARIVAEHPTPRVLPPLTRVQELIRLAVRRASSKLAGYRRQGGLLMDESSPKVVVRFRTAGVEFPESARPVSPPNGWLASPPTRDEILTLLKGREVVDGNGERTTVRLSVEDALAELNALEEVSVGADGVKVDELGRSRLRDLFNGQLDEQGHPTGVPHTHSSAARLWGVAPQTAEKWLRLFKRRNAARLRDILALRTVILPALRTMEREDADHLRAIRTWKTPRIAGPARGKSDSAGRLSYATCGGKVSPAERLEVIRPKRTAPVELPILHCPGYVQVWAHLGDNVPAAPRFAGTDNRLVPMGAHTVVRKWGSWLRRVYRLRPAAPPVELVSLPVYTPRPGHCPLFAARHDGNPEAARKAAWVAAWLRSQDKVTELGKGMDRGAYPLGHGKTDWTLINRVRLSQGLSPVQ